MSPKPLRTNFPNRGNSVDYAKLAKTGWQESGILVVYRNDERLSWDQKFMIDQLGNSIHGDRK